MMVTQVYEYISSLSLLDWYDPRSRDEWNHMDNTKPYILGCFFFPYTYLQ